jgi:uncharacterized protein (DUF1697 family)
MRAVALLRGINVGKGKRIAMEDLRAVASSLGWTDVSTLLATGNLFFTSPRGTPATLAAALEKALVRDAGLSSRVVVLSASQVETVLREQPFGAKADNPSRLIAGAYIDESARAALLPLTKKDWGRGAFALGTHAAYMWCPDGILESPLVEAVAKAAQDTLTSRNWATWGKMGTGVFSTKTR